MYRNINEKELPRKVVEIKHSESKPAWNIIGTELGGAYKIARIPYNVSGNDIIDHDDKERALTMAKFLCNALNERIK